MTDKELIVELRKPWFTNGCELYQLTAADRIEALVKEVKDERAAKFKMRDERDAAKIAASNYADFNHTWRKRAEAAGAENDRLREALGLLDKAAGEVARMGAVTGPQWTCLSIALLKGRAILKPAPTVTAGWPIEEGEESVIVGETK